MIFGGYSPKPRLTSFSQFNMMVSYTYRSDDPVPLDGGAEVSPRKSGAGPEMKTFSFYTVVDLGVIVPREESGVSRAD